MCRWFESASGHHFFTYSFPSFILRENNAGCVMRFYFLLGLLFFLSACEESHEYVPNHIVKSVNARDPVGVFCGKDCSGCDFNVHECQQMVQSNLPTLCDKKKDNCYMLWVRYSRTCEYLCAHPQKNLAGDANLINITFFDREMAL